MLLNSQGYAYLLKPCPAPKRPTPTSPPPPSEDGQPSSSSSTQPTGPDTSAINISLMDKGKGRASESEEEEITPERWSSENDQVVSGLYFTVLPIYQAIVYNLVPKTINKLLLL